MDDRLIWAGALTIAGAIVGSFIAALVIRWPQGRSVMRGRSHCDACGTGLAPHDLVPIVSAALLGQRCRYCGAPIDALHGRVELLCAALGGAAGLVAAGPPAIAGAAFGWLLATLALLDWRCFWLPDRLTATLAAAGFATGAIGLAPSLGERAIGGLAGCGCLWLVGEGYRRWRGRTGLGGGDPKLLGAIGLWLGWRLLPAVLLVAALAGLGIVAWRALRGRAIRGDDALPLGTLLTLAAYPAWLAMIAAAR